MSRKYADSIFFAGDQLKQGRLALIFRCVNLIRLGIIGAIALSVLCIGEGFVFSTKNAVNAQEVTADLTAGTVVDTNGLLTPMVLGASDQRGFVITGGTQRNDGNSLFHSFDTFSPNTVPTEFRLDDTQSGVVNIFGRVTGRDFDNTTMLNGLLQVIGGNQPNLFLINPNGIVMGSGATLNVPGAVFLSTAESIRFEEGGDLFSVSSPVIPLLTISTPVGLQFGEIAAPIKVEGQFSRNLNPSTGSYYRDEATFFRPGAEVSLIGGDILLKEVYFRAASSQFQIGSVGANSQVDINPETYAVSYVPGTVFQDIEIENSLVDLSSFEDGSGGSSGSLSLQGREIMLSGANLISNNFSSEDGGSIRLSASDSITAEVSRVGTNVFAGRVVSEAEDTPDTFVPSTGGGGDIAIATNNLVIQPNTRIRADTNSIGDAGNITIDATDVSITGTDIRDFGTGVGQSALIGANTFDQGNSGSITIDADSLTMSGLVFILANTYPENGSGLGSLLTPGVQSGAGGSITLDIENSLIVQEGAQIATSSSSDAVGGVLTIRAKDIILRDSFTDFDNVPSPVTAAIVANAYGLGDGGALTIEAADTLTVSGVAAIQSISLDVYGPGFDYGNGGSITIDARSVELRDYSTVSADSYTTGDSGRLAIYADELTVGGQENEHLSDLGIPSVSQISTAVYGGGNSQDLLLDVGQLTIGVGGQVGGVTFGSGNAGNIEIFASRGIDISGSVSLENPENPDGPNEVFPSGIFNSVAELGATGNGGNLLMETPRLDVRLGSMVSSRTLGDGNAGDIEIRANELSVGGSTNGEASRIAVSVDADASGNGGQLDIMSDCLRVYSGGFVTASTDGMGNAGSIIIQAGEIDVEGTSDDGVFNSSITSRSTTEFNAGSVTLTGLDGTSPIDRLSIKDQGSVSVSSLAGGDAGNVTINSRVVSLSNGSIEARVSAGSQGNVTIDSQDMLLLRRGSVVTANAEEEATGGNITLNSAVIVGLENSDITANATQGDGGNIRLLTSGLVGIALRDQLTSESDITASSEFGVSGTVNVESPSVATDSGLAQLPEGFVNASAQVAATCATWDDNRFTMAGRGGLPESPFQQLNSHSFWIDFRMNHILFPPAEVQPSDSSTAALSTAALSSVPAELLEASQWQLNEGGEIVLLADQVIAQPSPDCLKETMLSQHIFN